MQRPDAFPTFLYAQGMDLAERMERTQWDTFWVPKGCRVTDREEFLALSCGWAAPHLNVVLRTRAPASRLPALIKEARALHPKLSRWFLPTTFDARPVETALQTAGYSRGHRFETRVLEIAKHTATKTRFELRFVGDHTDLTDFYSVLCAAFPNSTLPPQHILDHGLTQCTAPDGRVRRIVAYDGREPIACGGLTCHADLGIALLWAGCTVPNARGQGAYSAVLHERLRHAVHQGISHAGLYALEDTSAPIVAKQGFECVGEMTYWSFPPE